MIIAEMNKLEVLKEFWNDYKETIRPRTLRWIEANKKMIKEKQKRTGEEIVTIDKIRTADINHNHYQISMKAGWVNEKPKFIATVWMMMNNIKGVKSALMLPAEENKDYLIEFSSHFLYEYGKVMGFNGNLFEITAEFMKADKQFSAEIDEDTGRFNVDLGNSRFGTGTYSEGWFKVDNFYFGEIPEEKIEKEEIENQKTNKEDFSGIDFDNLSIEDQKRLAWAEWENNRF